MSDSNTNSVFNLPMNMSTSSSKSLNNNNIPNKLWTQPEDGGNVITTCATTLEEQESMVGISRDEMLTREKQMQKLKRFFETVYNFSSNFSTQDTGPTVKRLIQRVIENDINPGEFFKELQKSTKFPLRPFVVSFLHSSLPLLREQYSTQQEKCRLWIELFDSFSTESINTDRGRKRLASENSSNEQPEKRMRLPDQLATDAPALRFLPLGNMKDTNRLSSAFGSIKTNNNSMTTDPWTWYSEDWRHIESLFSTMVSTMERLRYVILLFQQRTQMMQLWANQPNQRKDPATKINEVQRKADAAVKDVKKVAVQELQKAVAAAEEKASNMVAAQRSQMERILYDFMKQEDKIENCRNCGRKASQACSDCSVVRYCSTFCQHKDWVQHRITCDKRVRMDNDHNNTLRIKLEKDQTSERPSPKSI